MKCEDLGVVGVFISDEEGTALIEYVILLSAIAVVCFSIFLVINGERTRRRNTPASSTAFDDISTASIHEPDQWPPAIKSPNASTVVFPFRFLFMKVRGYIADFRKGDIVFSSAGITIAGLAQPRAEIVRPAQLLILLLPVNVLVQFFLIGIVSAVLQYGLLRPKKSQIPWNEVQQIVLEPTKRRACIIWGIPSGQSVDTYNLAFTLHSEQYDTFSNTAYAFAPTLTTEGKLSNSSTFGIFILMLAWAKATQHFT